MVDQGKNLDWFAATRITVLTLVAGLMNVLRSLLEGLGDLVADHRLERSGHLKTRRTGRADRP